mgnify:FL=1
MKINRMFHFSMGHTLHDYVGKCANLHGHNYQLSVIVESDTLNDQGMVMDFGDMKDIVKPIIDKQYDHRFLVYQCDPRADTLKLLDPTVKIVQFNPTAEWLVLDIEERLLKAGLQRIAGLRLWETEESYAEI